MKIRISLLASVLFSALLLFAGNAIAHDGEHSDKDKGAKHEKQEEGSGSSVMDSQGEKKGHEYKDDNQVKDEGSSGDKGKSQEAPGHTKKESN